MRRDVFQAIADPTRREIIQLVSRKSLHLNEVADHFEVSRPAISKHVRILAECGLVRMKQEGRMRYCEADLKNLNQVADWVEQYREFWTQRLDALELYLQQIQQKQNPTPKTSYKKASKKKK